MRTNYIENEYAKFWIQDEWLLCIQYKARLEITLDVAIDCSAIRMELSNEEIRPMFSDARNAVSIQKEARRYLSRQTAYVSAGAFLIDSGFHKALGGLFIALNRPPIPTRLFTNEKEAIKWLSLYKCQKDELM